MSHIPQCDSLKTLTIDTADVHPSWMRNIRLLESLASFPNLQHVTLPQEALINTNEDTFEDSFTELPGSIQHIGVIDPPQLLNAWALHISNRRSELPALSRICFWCDRNSEPLDYAESEIFVSNNRRDIDRMGDIMKRITISDSIWDSVRRLSITVEKHDRTKRLGWRGED